MSGKTCSCLIIANIVAATMLGCLDVQKNIQLCNNRYLEQLDSPRFDMHIGKSEECVFDTFGQPSRINVLSMKDCVNELTSGFEEQFSNGIVKEVYYQLENGEFIFWLRYEDISREWKVVRDAAIPVDWEF